MSVSVEYGRHGISSTRECEIRDKTVISTPLSTGALVFVSRIAFGCLEWWKSQILWRNEKFLMRISAVTFLFKTPTTFPTFRSQPTMTDSTRSISRGREGFVRPSSLLHIYLAYRYSLDLDWSWRDWQHPSSLSLAR